MKTRDDTRPSFNVQTAVETDNHLIVDYEVTNECADWNLLESGINGAKAALGVGTLEGIADRGYGSSDEVPAEWRYPCDVPQQKRNMQNFPV